MGSRLGVFCSVSRMELIRPASTGSLWTAVARLFLESVVLVRSGWRLDLWRAGSGHEDSVTTYNVGCLAGFV
jgi:hypothetical protein